MTMKRTHLLPLLVIVLLVLAVTHRYLLNGVPHEFITGEYKGTFEGDYDFTLELVDDWKDWKSVPLWSSTYSGPIAVFASNFHVFEQGLMYFLTHDLALSIKILQVLQILIAGFGMYMLSVYIFGKRTAAVFSAVVYMFSPFYLGHLLSYLHYTGVYMLAPLVYLLILKSIREGRAVHMVALSLIMTYSLFSHPQNVFIGGLFYTLFFILVSAHELLEGRRLKSTGPALKRVLKAAAVSGVLVFLLSAFIVLPTVVHNYPYMRTSWIGSDPELVKVDVGHIGSHSQTILAAITLQHWPWFQTPLKGSEYPPWYHMAVYIIPFLFASLSILFWCNWLTFVFMVITVLSVQIALGVNGKPDMFSFLARTLPYFGMSRTPYSYINHALMVFCLFASVTFFRLSEKVAAYLKSPAKRTTGPEASSWMLLFILLTPYLISAHYYGTIYNWTLIPAKEPRYLSQVWSWMEKNNKGRYRVIETCGIPTAMLLGQRMLPNGVDLLERYHKKDYLDRFLSLFGFKYVITPTLHSQRRLTFDRKGYRPPSVFDRGESMEEYYSALTTEYYFMYERLKSDPHFRLHRAGTKDVAIFENTEAFEDFEIYPARALMVLGGTDSYDLLDIKKFNSGELKPAPLFIAQSRNLERIDEIRTVTDELVLHNTDALDLYMLLNRDGLIMARPRPQDPELWQTAVKSFGTQQPFPQLDHSIGNSLFGELTFSDTAVTTSRQGAGAQAYFDIKRPGTYMVLLRTYGGEGMSNLSTEVDGHKRVLDQSGFSGYRWMELYKGRLDKGRHSVFLRTTGKGSVYLDTIAVVDAASIDPAGAMERLGDPETTYIMNYRRFVFDGKELSTDFYIGKKGRYVPSIRLGRFKDTPAQGEVRLFIDQTPAGGIPLSRLDSDIKEFSLPEIKLAPGRHNIKIAGLTEGVYFSMLAFTQKGGRAETVPRLVYSEKGPSHFHVRSSSKKPFLVVLNETLYPGWRAYFADGGKEEPLVTNMFMSGFIVPGGDTAFDVYYSNRVQNTGIMLSLLTLSALFVFVVTRTAGACYNRLKKHPGGKE